MPTDIEVYAEYQLGVDRSTWPAEKNISTHTKLKIKPGAFGVVALNPRPYTSRELSLGGIKYWELTQRKPLQYKTQHHSTTNSTLWRIPHLSNKQNKNTNQISSRQDYHLTQPCPSKEKQTKIKHKYHPIRTLHKPLNQTQISETKRKKEFNLETWEKETSNTISLKK